MLERKWLISAGSSNVNETPTFLPLRPEQPVNLWFIVVAAELNQRVAGAREEGADSRGPRLQTALWHVRQSGLHFLVKASRRLVGNYNSGRFRKTVAARASCIWGIVSRSGIFEKRGLKKKKLQSLKLKSGESSLIITQAWTYFPFLCVEGMIQERVTHQTPQRALILQTSVWFNVMQLCATPPPPPMDNVALTHQSDFPKSFRPRIKKQWFEIPPPKFCSSFNLSLML